MTIPPASSSTISSLPAVTTPAPTDLFWVDQVNPQSPTGYTSRKETSNQLLTGGGIFIPVTSITGLGTGVAAALAAALNAVGGLVGFSSLGTGVFTALGINVGSAGSVVLNGGALGTPSSGTLTNTTGLPIAGVTGWGTGVATALGNNTNSASGLVVENSSGYLVSTPMVGVINGSTPPAGTVGELITSDIPIGSAVSATTATPLNVGSVSLTAGNWDCWGVVVTNPNVSTTTTQLGAWISTVSAAIPSPLENGGSFGLVNGSFLGVKSALSAGKININVTTTTTVYLSAQVTFSGSTLSCFGFIGCRRVS